MNTNREGLGTTAVCWIVALVLATLSLEGSVRRMALEHQTS
jgi:hypothetical protein